MGNCVTCKRVSAEIDETPREEAIERKGSVSTSTTEVKTEKKIGGKTKKTVRFKLDDDDNNGGGDEKNKEMGSKGGAVRIRVVVTQRELIQILSNQSKYSSAEQLLAAMKLKSRKISDHEKPNNGGWRPALESIPEDQ